MIKLLLVDDIAANLLVLEQLVDAPDRQLIRASSGDEALEVLFQQQDFAVILMDVQMPGISGFETVRLLRTRDDCRDIPIIFITAFDKYGAKEMEAYAQGGVDYVMKPIQSQILISKVDVFVDLYRMRQSLALSNAQLEQANQKLQRQMDLKSEFLANMSHELRTPMNSIIGFTGRVLKKASDVLSPRHIKNLKTVERNAHHLLSLINSLLDLSKIEAGKMEIYAEEFVLGDLLQEVIELTDALVDDKGLTIQADVPNQPVLMYSDKTKLKQILINLVSNAVKFTDEGGVTLQARAMLNADEPGIEIRVIDTGIGMQEDTLNYIFEAFRQIDGSTTRSQGGTGLGLNITSRFCDLLGGGVDVESEMGVGSSFIVKLPLHCPSQVSPDASAMPDDALAVVDAASMRSEGAGPVVLCVDDNAEVLELLAEYLAEEGYRAVCVNNGKDALAQARALQPIAITLDVQMPYQDGWSVLKALKADPSTCNIPVLMATMMGNKALGFKLGAFDYLEKPISPDNLIKSIQSVPTRIRHVLVIDDDEGVRDLMQQSLEDIGILSTQAVDGVDALAQLEAMGQALPDMLLLDLMMPRMNGFEVLDKLAEHDVWSKIPVLVSTAKTLSAEERLELESKARSIIQKGGDSLDRLMSDIQQAGQNSPESMLK